MSEEAQKKHLCRWSNCGKSFSRSDHLRRHMLNHSSEGRTCPRCRAHFKRPDLLERHISRHKQRDEEAGGEGLGVVETRKRLWRDADGNIVSKRPSHIQQVQSLAGNVECDRDLLLDYEDTQHMADGQAPPSPPRSNASAEVIGSMSMNAVDISQVGEHQNFEFVQPMVSTDQADANGFDFLKNSTWGQPAQPEVGGMMDRDRIFDDVFNPDTASSFNMPFTTLNNYNWLFDISGDAAGPNHQSGHHTNASRASMFSSDLHVHQHAPQNTTVGVNQMNGYNMRPTWMNGHMLHPHQSIPLQNFLALPDHQAMIPVTDNHQAGCEQDDIQLQSSDITTSAVSTSPDALSTSDYSMASSQTSRSQYYSSVHRARSPIRKQPPPSPYSSDLGLLSSFHHRKEPQQFSEINENARERLLDFITDARTRTPDGTLISRCHPLLSLPSLQSYYDLFFSQFNVAYPLIHVATFNPDSVEPTLLLSVILLGATYADKSAHRLAVCIHDVMRAQIFQHCAFTATPELWMLQTILLVECFGKSRAGQKQHDMAHLFHGLLINLIRRSDCQTVHEPGLCDPDGDLEGQWRTAVDIEQRKRVAFLCFMWDTQHAVLFSQSLCMSSFELRTALPCSPAIWEAQSAEEWYHHSRREPPPKLFLPVLKSYMSPSNPSSSNTLSALSRLLILHGLMSVSWDMNRRDQTSLDSGSMLGSDDWRTRIGASYDVWKADFDTYCLNISSSLGRGNPDQYLAMKSDFQRFVTSTTAIYHSAHIILNVEILDMQVFAGADHIIGRPVTRIDRERSRSKISTWAPHASGSSSSCTAAWHAAQLLREGITNLDQWDVNNVFHYPWCLYLATLTCWAFHYSMRDGYSSRDTGRCNSNATPREEGSSAGMGSTYAEEDSLWDAKGEMNALVSGMTSGVPEGLRRIAGRYPTKGLTSVMAKHLGNVRWAVVHEGMKVLKGLANP